MENRIRPPYQSRQAFMVIKSRLDPLHISRASVWRRPHIERNHSRTIVAKPMNEIPPDKPAGPEDKTAFPQKRLRGANSHDHTPSSRR